MDYLHNYIRLTYYGSDISGVRVQHAYIQSVTHENADYYLLLLGLWVY